MEQNKLKRFERIIQNFLLIIVFVVCSVAIFKTCESCSAQNKLEPEPTGVYYACDTLKDTIVAPIRTQLTVTNELIDEVEKYIKTKTNKHHQLIPKYLVLAGLKNDIDICFMMAQTQVETCYGTLGAGREVSRRSLFGVAIHKYGDYEKAINHYCEVLHKYYLKPGKTEQHLMSKYVTNSGARYAENPNYEHDIRTAYNHIKKHTNIYNLQEEYKNI